MANARGRTGTTALEMAARIGLVTEIMQYDAGHAIGDAQISRIARGSHSQILSRRSTI